MESDPAVPAFSGDGQSALKKSDRNKKCCEVNEVELEATTRIELVYTVLQFYLRRNG